GHGDRGGVAGTAMTDAGVAPVVGAGSTRLGAHDEVTVPADVDRTAVISRNADAAVADLSRRGMPASGENGDTAGPGIDDDVAAVGTCASGSFINASVSDLNEVPVVGLRLVCVEDDVPALGGDADVGVD